MEKSLDFERKLKKLLKSKMDEKSMQELDFTVDDGKCTWMNAMCLSLAHKAAKGDINAIKYVNEICRRSDDEKTDGPVSITVRVVE